MKKVKQTMIQIGGLGAKLIKYTRVIKVDKDAKVDGEVVDNNTPVSDWTEETE